MNKESNDDHLKDIPMLSQPLLTEEGFLNPACINEMENVFANMPETYERLQDDPEWTKKYWTFIDNITGALAKWAIRQSPYACPDNLETVIKYLEACLQREFEKLPEEHRAADMGRLSLCEVNKFLHDILGEFDLVKQWNECKNGDTPNLSFTDRYAGKQNPDDEFIDLGALFHNVSLDLRLERRASDKFDKEFEEEYGEIETKTKGGDA